MVMQGNTSKPSALEASSNLMMKKWTLKDCSVQEELTLEHEGEIEIGLRELNWKQVKWRQLREII